LSDRHTLASTKDLMQCHIESVGYRVVSSLDRLALLTTPCLNLNC
jgi:hypothetical protein